MYRLEKRRLTRPQAFCLIFLVLTLTVVTNSIHRFYVDHGSIFPNLSNFEWQKRLQNNVINLIPEVAPHSYRFLPNSLVRWMECTGVTFEVARDIYRLFFGLLLFYALYRYARLFTNYLGALIALLLVATVYPVSFEYSAGQLTDPLSHLSFVLAFIFLETSDFAFLLTTLIIGALAKETVLAMAGSYALFPRTDQRYWAKTCVLLASAAAIYMAVRAFVLKSASHYEYRQISGVTPEHVVLNLANGRWGAVVFLIVGVLAVFLVIAWKETPLSLKRQALYLFPVLFLSSTLFSWLWEGRNFMPVTFILAVIAGNYLSRIASVSELPLENPLLPLQAAEGTDVSH